MSQEDHVGPGESLSRHEAKAWWDLLIGAGGLADSLKLSWRHPTAHDIPAQVGALVRAVKLEEACEATTPMFPKVRIFPVSPQHAKPRARYDVEAATRMIPHLLPVSLFGDPEQTRKLREAIRGEYPDRRIVEQQPEMVEYWHEWIWRSRPTASDATEEDRYEASELVIASARLATGAEAILRAAGAW